MWSFAQAVRGNSPSEVGCWLTWPKSVQRAENHQNWRHPGTLTPKLWVKPEAANRGWCPWDLIYVTFLFSKGSENVEFTIRDVGSAVTASWQWLTLLEHHIPVTNVCSSQWISLQEKIPLIQGERLRNSVHEIHRVRLKIIHIHLKNTSALGFTPIFNPSWCGQHHTTPLSKSH